MTRIAVAILLLFAIYFEHVVGGSSSCPEHEVFRACKYACEATCENPNPGICVERLGRACNRGCQCVAGYFRHGNICIHPSQCPIHNYSQPPN